MKRRTRNAPLATAPATQTVHFEFPAPEAGKVFLAGSFNDWSTNDLPMIRHADGKWAKDLTLAPGRYEYLFVVDDTWVPDPAATETVPNSFSGVNAIVVVPETGK